MSQGSKQVARAYQLLADSRNTAADAALAEALPYLDSTQREWALDILIQRAQSPSLLIVVSHFTAFDEAGKCDIIKRINLLGDPIRRCIEGDNLQARLSAIELIDQSADYRSAYLLALASGNRCAKTGRAAADALLALATGLDADKPIDEMHARQAHMMVDAIRQALMVWTVHFRGEVLLAATLLCEYFEDEFLEMIAAPRTQLLRAIENLLIAARHTIPARFFYVALRSPVLGLTAAALAARAEDKTIDRILNESWMTADPRIAKACVRIRDCKPFTDRLFDDELRPDVATSLTRRVMRLVSISGASPEQRAALLGKYARGADSEVARDAFWRLCDLNCHDSTQILRAVAQRTDDPLARFAKLEIRRRESNQQQSARPETEFGAEPSSAFDAFNEFWRQFESLESEDRRRIGRAMFETSPEYAHLLKSRLGSSSAHDVLLALSMVDQCAGASRFATQIRGMAGHSDPHVRAKAVHILGHINTAESHQALYLAMDDTDERVAANAVDAIDRLRIPDRARRLESKLNASQRRVKTAAIKALLRLRVRNAAIALIKLLHSNDPPDRLAGIWVANELGLGSVASSLEAMAKNDPDPAVRRRARAAVHGAAATAAQPPSGGDSTLQVPV